MNTSDVVVLEIDKARLASIPISSGDAAGTLACAEYPGDISQRLTLYVDYDTFIVEDGKLCGNWSASPENACRDRRRTYRIPRDGWSMALEYPCSNGSRIMQVEFGMSEAMTKVYPLLRGARCGINGEGQLVGVRNRDISRNIEVDIEVDSVPDPTNRYPVVQTVPLHPGEQRDLGCSEQNQASMTFRIVGARFI